MADRFWSDDLDMDLPKVFPEILDDTLGAAAAVPLWTYGGTSHGRLNHPAVWNTDGGGFAAYFGTTETGDWKPASFWTDRPLVPCTWREVIRDAWVHNYRVVVDRVVVWDTTRFVSTFNKLMYDLRGEIPLPDGEANRLRGQVLASVIAATGDLQRLVAVTPDAPMS